MDPVTLLLTALTTGAVAGMSATATEAVKDAYKGLRALVQRKFAGKPEAEMALAKHEEQPQVWEQPLKQTLAETGADKDEEIIQAAQKLMALVSPQQAAAGKYNVQITGDVHGFIQGDNAKVSMTFGDKPKEC